MVRAAGRLFARRGFHGTSMRDLGQELGLLGSSLYSHIEGKEQLLVEVIRAGGAMFQKLAEEVAASDGSPPERLRHLIAGHVTILVENRDEAATFLNEAWFLPVDARAEVLEMRDRYEGAFRALLAEGRASGDFGRVDDPAITATLVLSVLNALVRWFRPDGRLTTEEIADRIFVFVLEGIA